VEAVYATGIVEPVHWAKVASLVRGKILEHCMCEGKPVAKGDVLARLDDEEQVASVRELEARETFLHKELARYRQLRKSDTVSVQNYERVQSEHEQNHEAIAAARKRLIVHTIKAPIDGVVLRRDGEVGEVVEAGEVLFWVGRPSPLWITAEVDEEDIPLVQPGQATLIKSDAFPGRDLAGRVARITPKGDPVNKSFRVRVALPEDTPLMIGMTTEINIVVRTVEDALLVPLDALSENRVFSFDKGRVTARPVATGIKGQSRVQVTQGLDPGAKIVLDPPPGLRDGDRVRAKTAAGGK